jgi:Domain of unknown function (DUF5916)
MKYSTWAGAQIITAVLLGMALFRADLSGQAPAAGAGVDMEPARSAPESAGIVDLQRLNGPVNLDGFSNEAAWAGIEPLALTMYEPEFRGASDRRIQVLLAYDDEAIYVAGRFFHDDPSAIRAFSLTRDTWNGDDVLGVLFDTFNDNENAVRFVGLPLGAQTDMSVSGDGQQEIRSSTGPSGRSWNTYWDFETKITDEGWFGEMRIPFSSLRFEAEPDGSVIMGMMAYAYEPGSGDEGESRWTFPAMPRNLLYTQVSAWQDVRLRGVVPRNPVYVTPYGLANSQRAAQLSQSGDRFDQLTDQTLEFGGDIKLNPTRNLTLDLTINTDFASVEADQEQVNLTRFSLFFDEKRPFFQERAGIFAFGTGTERGTLFYSRRIGLADGRPVRILGGARLVGRVGNWDVGVIEMQTARDGALDSENFGVFRLRRRIFNPYSFIGGMATTRAASGGGYNVTYGVDGQFRVVGDDYFTFKWLQTVQGGSAERDAAISGVDAGRIVVDWTRRRFEGFSFRNVFVWSGPGYDPTMGFELRRDFTRVQSDWNYQWFPSIESPFRRIWLGVASNAWIRNSDDQVDTGQIRPFLNLELNDGTSFRLESNTRFEDVAATFNLSDQVNVLSGDYWTTEGSLTFGAPRGWSFRPGVTATMGQFFGGNRVAIRSNLDWPLGRHLSLRGGWEWNRIRFDDRGLAFDSNLLRLTVNAALDTRFSMSTFVQYNSLTDQLTTNARARYYFREGQDLWLVWNEGLNLERNVLGVPRLPRSQARTLSVKYTHTLIF